ncbi:MAG: radical SAM protein [Elusimicrobia bacterium]|nr:radical SAM protein [Elusimicrobiota bacterium]
MTRTGMFKDIFDKNIMLSGDEVWKKTEIGSMPRFLFFVLTTLCNLDCIFCSRVREGGGTFPEKGFDEILPVLPFVELIDWQGGEVFLVDYFREMFCLISDRFPRILHRITTNGLLIDSRWAELLASNSAVLNFSADSPEKRTYEKLRKNARFEDLERGLRLVGKAYGRAAARSHLSLTAVVMRSNLDQLRRFPDFCGRHGIGRLNFDFLRPGRIPSEDFILDRDAEKCSRLMDIIGEVEARSAELGVSFEYTFGSLLGGNREDTDRVREEFVGDYSADSRDVKIKREKICKLPWNRMFINYDGSVKPDCSCRIVAGNILDDGFAAVWNSGIMKEYRQRIIAGDVSGWCNEACLARALPKEQLEGS